VFVHFVDVGRIVDNCYLNFLSTICYVNFQTVLKRSSTFTFTYDNITNLKKNSGKLFNDVENFYKFCSDIYLEK
jgi:hypothetical protein